MKKVLKIALIIILALCMVTIITGCNNQKTKEEKREFSMGEWKDNVYENNFLGLKFTLPDGWEYESDEEIADEMELAKDLLTDKQQLEYEASKQNNVYYLAASNEDTADNIRIISEKSLLNSSTEKYIEAVKTGLEENDTIEYETVGITKEKVGSIDCDVLTLKGSYIGVSFMQRYYTYKIDNYFVSIIVTSPSGENGINEIMKYFE